MAIWALADLHLALGVPEKNMDVFGGEWVNHTEKVETYWRKLISEEDLVLIPGDISWAKYPQDALKDLEWIDTLPGTKVILRGNHDYWWGSLKKVKELLPPSIHPIHNNVYDWKDVTIGGSRLWDTPEYNFDDVIPYVENPQVRTLSTIDSDPEVNERIFLRELNRLEISLKALNPSAKTRICMTHYPPINHDLQDSRASLILEKYNIDICVFGHLHNVPPGSLPFGTKNGVQYILCACDYLCNEPVFIT